METRVTYCRICEAACGLLADVEQGQLLRLYPDKDHAVSRGFSCAKGTRFDGVHLDPDRVGRPQQRASNAEPWTSVGWHTALTDAGGKLAAIREKYGPHSIGVYVGNPSAFSMTLPLLATALVQGIGTRNYFNAGSLDCNNKFVVSREMFGSPVTHPVPDLDHADLALLVGTNPAVSQSSFINAPRFVERLRILERRGGHVITVDPRRSETARQVGQHIPINAGSDAELLLALLNVVFSEGLTDRQAVEQHTHDARRLEQAVAAFTPARVSARTGIDAETIIDLARRFAGADGAFCHVSTGVNQGPSGTVAYAAKIALEAVTGNLDRIGGGLLPRGAIDIAGLAAKLGLDKEPQVKSRIGNHPTVLGALPSGILADEILTPGPDQIRALIVIAGNPQSSCPDSRRMAQALSSLEVLVSADLYVNDTGAHGTHVLPSTDWLERADMPVAQLGLQPVPYLQWSDATVPARDERRDDHDIVLALARAMGVSLFGSRAADVAFRMALALGGAGGLLAPLLAPRLGWRPIERLRSRHPHGLRVDHAPPGDFLRKRLRTASRKVELFPKLAFEGLEQLATKLDSAPTGALRLITKREKLGHNSWMHNNARLEHGTQRAWLSPADARRLNVVAGERLRLSAGGKSLEFPVGVSADLIEGAVAVPHGWGHEAESGWEGARSRGGQNINELARAGPDAVDPVTGMTQFTGIEVTAEKVESASVKRRPSKTAAGADAE